jgi:hypothetical protein
VEAHKGDFGIFADVRGLHVGTRFVLGKDVVEMSELH